MGFTNFFEQFQCKAPDNPRARADNVEAMNTILSSGGSDAYDCTENFAKQDIEYKNLAALTYKDLELLGIRDKKKQIEMLEVFRVLAKQDYSWNDVITHSEDKEFNNKIISRTNSHLDTMKMSLSEANLKLQLKPAGDIVIDERHYASKFVLEALDELNKLTDAIDGRLCKLEMMADSKLQKSSDVRFKAVVTITSIILFFGICLWKKQNI